MTWAELILRVRHLLETEDLHSADSDEGALDELARLLRLHMPVVIAHPEAILGLEKRSLIEKLSTNDRLSCSQSQVLDKIYWVLSRGTEMALPAPKLQANNKVPKLEPLADCLSEIFEQFFKCSAPFTLEYQPDWLSSVPDRDVYDAVWEEVSAVYAVLVNERWTLSERVEEYASELKKGRQRVDIWFGAPINCMVEFDETQHFNQFRAKTLRTWDGYSLCSFDTDLYLRLAEGTTIRAGNTPFQRLKNFDPLFPPLLNGEAQDNRIRQRAFRDFLKDITPLVVPSVNPTMRISYETTHGRIRDFTQDDLTAVAEYIGQTEFLERITLA